MYYQVEQVLEQQEPEIEKFYKGRGLLICEAKQGLFALKEYFGSAQKAEFLYWLGICLEQQGILYRKRGVGSFVSQKIPPVSSSASETDSKSKMVSLLLPFATTQGNISETIGSLSAALAEKGYFLSIHITGSSSPKERATLELLRSQNIAGLVYYPKRDNIHLEQLTIPVCNARCHHRQADRLSVFKQCCL